MWRDLPIIMNNYQDYKCYYYYYCSTIIGIITLLVFVTHRSITTAIFGCQTWVIVTLLLP